MELHVQKNINKWFGTPPKKKAETPMRPMAHGYGVMESACSGFQHKRDPRMGVDTNRSAVAMKCQLNRDEAKA